MQPQSFQFRLLLLYALVCVAPFACLKVWLLRLVFLVGTVFFSHNNSAGTVFFSQFQPKFRPANGARVYFRLLSGHKFCSPSAAILDTLEDTGRYMISTIVNRRPQAFCTVLFRAPTVYQLFSQGTAMFFHIERVIIIGEKSLSQYMEIFHDVDIQIFGTLLVQTNSSQKLLPHSQKKK